MILVDTSVWIDHLRKSDSRLAQLLIDGEVLGHVDIAGELAMGSLHDRHQFLATLQSLPQAKPATREEAMHLIEQAQLYSRGLGWIDAQLLACARIERISLWARDARLRDAAEELGITQPLQ